MSELNTIYYGHALDLLRDEGDESVNCVITSPPYWGLRDYGLEPVVWGGDSECKHEWGDIKLQREQAGWSRLKWDTGGQRKDTIPDGPVSQGQFCQLCDAWRGSLGLEPTFELYISHLIQILLEVKRVLRKDGTCWVNLGDTYGGTKEGNDNPKMNDAVRTKSFTKSGGVTKSLCQIPSRFAIAMTDARWILRNELIWYKRNCMPSSAKDRFTVDFEKIFFFTKSKKYWFEQQKEPTDDYQKRVLKEDAQWKAKFKEQGGFSIGRFEDWKEKEYGCPLDGRNKRCVWDITTQSFADAHFAVFPEELVETPILSGCPEQGVVLDPFMGSGTVAKVALRTNRQFIGLEANQEYIDMANKRIEFHLKQMRLL